MATVSIKQVAQRAGVSVGTVSNVLNRPEAVSPRTRQRVREAIDELGFVRNESARHLRAGRSRTIGVVVLDVANPFFTDVARGVEQVADRNDSVVMLCNTGQEAERESRLLDLLEEQRARGVLITPLDVDDPRLQRLAERGIPVVLVDRRAGRNPRCAVAVDDVLGGRLAARHLLEQGHRDIAFVGGPLRIQQVADRHAGAAAALADVPDARLHMIGTQALTVEGGRRAATELAGMPAAERPTAVCCANDLLALGMLQELTRAGLRVPGDVAIVGYDDIDFAGAAAVPLSSVRQPRELLGRTAAELLLEEIGDPAHRHRQVVFEPDLVVRESSATPRSAPAGPANRTTRESRPGTPDQPRHAHPATAS